MMEIGVPPGLVSTMDKQGVVHLKRFSFSVQRNGFAKRMHPNELPDCDYQGHNCIVSSKLVGQISKWP
eukprot:3904798-Amphidinium_carterae.1